MSENALAAQNFIGHRLDGEAGHGEVLPITCRRATALWDWEAESSAGEPYSSTLRINKHKADSRLPFSACKFGPQKNHQTSGHWFGVHKL